MARKKPIQAKKIVIGLVIAVVGSVVGTLIYVGAFTARVYRVQIIPIGERTLLKIGAQTLRKKPNQDGVLFVQAVITSDKASTTPMVEVQPVDETKWYKQHVQETGKSTYIARIQLGSREWPIRGGETYLLRASNNQGEATARISVERAPPGSE